MFILLEIDFMDNGFQTELIDISYVYQVLTCINYYIIHFTAQRAFQYLTQGKCSKLVNMLDTPCLTCKFKCLKGIIVIGVF